MTFRWPWVSRLAYDVVTDERDRLRVANDTLTEALTRVRRHEAGMAETPREPRKQMEPMPIEIAEYARQAGNPSMRREMLGTAYRMHARGMSWDEIKRQVMEPEDGDAAVR